MIGLPGSTLQNALAGLASGTPPMGAAPMPGGIPAAPPIARPMPGPVATAAPPSFPLAQMGNMAALNRAPHRGVMHAR